MELASATPAFNTLPSAILARTDGLWEKSTEKTNKQRIKQKDLDERRSKVYCYPSRAGLDSYWTDFSFSNSFQGRLCDH